MLQDVPDELKGRTDTKGEASMRGHLSAEGAEQTGSQAYVPPDEKNDKALNAAAYNTLRGVTVNAGVPRIAQGDGSELADNPRLIAMPAPIHGDGFRCSAV